MTYFETLGGLMLVRLHNNKNLADDYVVKNECPKCGAAIVKKSTLQCCFENNKYYVHVISCTNNCNFSHGDLKRFNNIID